MRSRTNANLRGHNACLSVGAHSGLTSTVKVAPPPKEAVETSGAVFKFLYNAHGDSGGFILDGEKQVHFPPHLSAEVLKNVNVGERIHVHGKKLAAVGLTIAASITQPGGARIVDHGPPHSTTRIEEDCGVAVKFRFDQWLSKTDIERADRKQLRPDFILFLTANLTGQ